MAPSITQLETSDRQNKLSSKASSASSTSKEDTSKFDPSLSLSPTQSPSNFDDNSTITYLFPDFNALKLICSKSQTYEEVTISGFEIYIVEQWACERKYSTVITSYTGDSDHVIKVGKLVLPTNSSKWSEKIQHYFKEIELSGAKPKTTDHGYLFITNLSQFPSNLNLLPVPTGSVLDVWDCFVVNLNLRKMQCGGRSAIMLCSPADAAEDKFRQIYKIAPKVDIMYAVRELVTLVQICLVDFKLLDPLFADGLFCQKTEARILDWWNIYGTMYFGITPKDGILGPTTVSALLGFVLSCHFRLDMAGSDFPKEPFNYFNFRVNVGKFQKQYNLPRTWYLDPSTVEKLFRVTSKVSTSDLSKLKKVVKSTVHDISGKPTSEHSAVEVLTTDIDKAIKYFGSSPRLEYLWLGKGEIRDLKSFDYNLDRLGQNNSSVQNIVSSSTLRSGVDKIKSFPRRLQSDESNPRKRDRKIDGQSMEACALEDFSKSCIDDPTNLPECSINKIQEGCCKVADFKQGLHRRTSFPYLRKDITIFQLEYENHYTSLTGSQEENTTLRRVKSCSFIDDAILQWKSPITEERLANIHIDTEYKLRQHKKQSKIENKQYKKYRESLNDSSQKLFNLKHQTAPLFNLCDYENTQQERAIAKMRDIQATGARLEYEIRLLSTKVRDTEESVDDFVRKVSDLEHHVNERFLQFQSKSEATTEVADASGNWYSRLISNERFWKYIGKLQDYSVVQWASGKLNSQELIESKLRDEGNHTPNTQKNYTKPTITNELITNNNEKLKHT